MELLKSDVGKVALGGAIAVAGQLMATLIGWAKEVWFDRKKRRKEAEYLAIRLMVIFDELVSACYSAVHDPLRQDEQGCSESTVDNPTLSLPTDGDYKALPRRLMFQIMLMPSKLDGIMAGMGSAYDMGGPPDYEELFEYRTEHCSRLGLEALDLIAALCREYKIPPPDRSEYYNPRDSFLKEIAAVQQVQRERSKANEKFMASFLESQSKNNSSQASELN